MPFNYEVIYNQIVEEICKRQRPKYDSLVIFVHNLLASKVEYWCNRDSVLNGQKLHDDIMQEIQILIIKKCEFYFFKPINGNTDKTCEEFKSWCYKVGKNYFVSYCKKNKKDNCIELDDSINSDNQTANEYNPEIIEEKRESVEERRQALNHCIMIVLDLKSSPHIILTWLAVSLFMISDDSSKIKSTHQVAEKFSRMTLFEMFDYILKEISVYDWVEIPKEQGVKQRERLEEYDKTGRLIGSLCYSDFYMKKGAEMSISDWVNRINSQIRLRW